MAATFTWRGDWTSGGVYGYYDVIKYQGIIYLSVNQTNFTSTVNPATDTSMWNVMLASGINGTGGTSGTSGTNGTSGIAGSSGTSGTSGTTGTSGTSGATGSSGISGSNGSSGTSGTSGVNGTSGAQGAGFNTISNPGDNRILTSNGSANAAAAEQNLSFDGSSLNLVGKMNINQQTLTDGASISWNFLSGANSSVTLAGNRSLNITNMSAGDTGIIIVKQDGTGGRTMTLPANSTVVGNGTYSLSGTPNAKDVLGVYYDGTTYFWTIGAGVVGAQGSQGLQGANGQNGNSGTSGTSGTTGTSGTSGVSGSSGTSGVNGSAGTSGVNGGSGPQGSQGLQGFQGVAGSSGVNGAVGDRGLTGFQGSGGSSGTSGVNGGSGPQGSQGNQGFQGVAGSNGQNGGAGAQGPAGPTGPQGAAGAAGGFTTGSNAQVNSLGVGTAATGTAGQIVATNDIIAYYSDARLKINQGVITDALDKIFKISGIYYTQNELAEKFGYSNYAMQVGVVAQEIQAVMPEIVKLAPFDTSEDGNSISGENYITVQYEKLVPLLIQGIKELAAKVEALENKLNA